MTTTTDPLLSVELGQADFAYIFNPILPNAIYAGVNIPEAQVSGQYDDGDTQYTIQCRVGVNPMSVQTFKLQPNPQGTYDEVAITLAMSDLNWSARRNAPDDTAARQNGPGLKDGAPPTVTITGRFDVAHLRATLPQFDLDSLWALRGDPGQALLPHQIIRLLVAASYGAAARVNVSGWDEKITNGISCAFAQYLQTRTVLDLQQITGNDTGSQNSGTNLSYAYLAYPKSLDFGASAGGGSSALVAMMSVSGRIDPSQNKVAIGSLFENDVGLNGALVAAPGIVTQSICGQLQNGNLPGGRNFTEFVRKTVDGSFNRDTKIFPFGYVDNSFSVNFTPSIVDHGNYIEILNTTYDQKSLTPDYTIHHFLNWDNFYFSYKTTNNLTAQYSDPLELEGGFGALSIAGTSTFSGSVRYSINNGPAVIAKEGSENFNNNQSGQSVANDIFQCSYSVVSFSDIAKDSGVLFSAVDDNLTLPNAEISNSGTYYVVSDKNMFEYLYIVSGRSEINVGEGIARLFAIQFPIIAEVVSNTQRKDTAVTLTELRLLRTGGFGADLLCVTVDLDGWLQAPH